MLLATSTAARMMKPMHVISRQIVRCSERSPKWSELKATQTRKTEPTMLGALPETCRLAGGGSVESGHAYTVYRFVLTVE